jgi:hypothetical protein
MVLIKVRSGPPATSILALGRITRNADSVSKCTRMHKNMKEAGSTINDMGKVRYGCQMRVKISAEDTPAIGSTTKRKEEARCFSATKIDMMDSGRTIGQRARAV